MEEKTDFNDFFGPNVLYKAGPDDESYDLKKKLNIEIFLVIVIHINYLKHQILENSENLIIELVELIGQFANLDSMNYEINNEIIVNYNCKHFSELIKLENDINENSTFENNSVIQQVIENNAIINTFLNSTNDKLFESKLDLILLKTSLNDFLNNYQLPKFKEPEQQSITKIEFLYDILIKSQEKAFESIKKFKKSQIDEYLSKFTKINNNLTKSFQFIQTDLIDCFNKIDNLTKRKEELINIRNDLSGLFNLYLSSVKIINEIKLIDTSITYNNENTNEFNKNYYQTLLKKQRNKLSFLENFINKSIQSINDTNVQLSNNAKLLNILQTTPSDERSLTHSLIQSSFNIHSDPIQLLFNKFDKSSKGFLTKTEFKSAFIKAYPMSKDIESEIELIFETNYEIMKKSRRGMEYPQFNAVIKLGMKNLKNSSELSSPISISEISPFASPEKKNSTIIDFQSIVENVDELSENSINDYHINGKLFKELKSITNSEISVSSIVDSISNNEQCMDNKINDISILQVLTDLERIDLDKLV